jgi:large subunit ribosomal protein L36e
MRYGMNHGHPTTPIAKVVRPSQRKGVQSTKTKFVRSVIREVAGFSAYERRVMELLRNSKVSCVVISFFFAKRINMVL